MEANLCSKPKMSLFWLFESWLFYLISSNSVRNDVFVSKRYVKRGTCQQIHMVLIQCKQSHQKSKEIKVKIVNCKLQKDGRSFTLHCSKVKKVWWLVVDFVFHHFTKLCLVSFYSFMLRFFLYFSGGFCHDPVWRRRRRRRRSVFSQRVCIFGGSASRFKNAVFVRRLPTIDGKWSLRYNCK